MLIGVYQHRMDAKKRVPMPAKLRQQLGPKVVVTRGLEGCLFVYAMPVWEEFSAKVNALPMSQAKSRSFARLIFSGAMEVELDGLGRILIPDYLKKYANLEKEVIVAGSGNRLELWNKDKWEAYESREVEDIEDNAEGLREFGV